MHFACRAVRCSPILQLYSTTKASQHQISQQQSFSSGLIAGKLATFLWAVQNTIQGFKGCFPPGTDRLSTHLGGSTDVDDLALWGCKPSSGSALQASLPSLGWKTPPAEHKPISSVRALGKHLESNSNPPHTSRGCSSRGLLFQASYSTR